MTEPWVLLVTRLGLGIDRDRDYRHRVRVAELALAASLRAQTDTSFTWVLARDIQAPGWVDSEFEGMARGLSFDIWPIDPTTAGMFPVDRAVVRSMASSRPTILSRCDDDDLLHRTYMARTRRELAGRSPPCALTFGRGGNLIDGKVYPVDYPWTAAGLAVLTDEQAKITPYGFSHTRFPIRMRDQGFEALEIPTPYPMWLRSVSAFSDSAARRRIRPRWWQRPTKLDLADFGATSHSLQLLRSVLAEAPAGPIQPPPGRTRLQEKTELARKIRALKRAAIRTDEDEAEIERLTATLYDL